MAAFDIGHHTAKLFAGLWHVRRSPWFLQYIEVAFNAKVSQLPDLKAVIITEAEAGDVQHGWVHSLATRNWVSDDGGFRAVTAKDVPPWAKDTNAAGDAGRLYSGWAKFHFFADGDLVAVRGILGPQLRCRMVGRVAAVCDVLCFTDVRVPEFAMHSICQQMSARAELDLPGQIQD